MKIRLWQAIMLGGLLGLALGAVLEIGRQLRAEASTTRMIAEFERQGMIPPLMIDNLRPQVIPLLSCFLFALLFSLIHIWWERR